MPQSEATDAYKVKLTQEVKALARQLGAKLVGVASVERFQKAPLLHSPQGLMPTAQSVVVAATIWMDAAMELTEKEIAEHWHNPADICECEGGMGHRLNPLIFKLARFLEDKGYRSLPLPQTGYWRWRSYKSMPDGFAPPLAHRYAAVAAGLGEIGWHNSFVSPQYGPRQRVVSLLTEAPLQPDPLYEGPPLCDKCMRCVKACPYERFTQEVEAIVELDIGGKKITLPRTNKWRCHLCYYEINPRFLPRHITEEVALRIENDGRQPKEGRREGVLMDSAACLAACLPPPLRKKEAHLYPHSLARRRRKRKIPPPQATEKIRTMCQEAGADFVYIGTAEEFLSLGVDLQDYMPYARSVILFGIHYADPFMCAASLVRLRKLGYDLACYLQEDLGHYTLQLSRLAAEQLKRAFRIAPRQPAHYYHILTSLRLQPLRETFRSKHS